MEAVKRAAALPKGLAFAAVICLAVLATSGVVVTWQALRSDAGVLPGRPGSLYSVQLVNGQIYYGTLAQSAQRFVELADVYYVHTVSLPNGAGVRNQLVSRRKTDWHAPEWMAIPLDQVLFIEQVGPGSQLARLIAQDRGAKPAR